MADEILNAYTNQVKELVIIPSSGGVFEVTLNNQKIFSKKELERFPDEGEVMDTIKSII